MGLFSKIIGGSIAEPIEALGNVFDKLFTTDKEKMHAQAVLEKLRQQPAILQAEINKIEAAHQSIFIAGWRPAIGWTCAIGLFYSFLIRPIMIAFHINAINLDMGLLITLVTSLLGLEGVSHIVKKRNGKELKERIEK